MAEKYFSPPNIYTISWSFTPEMTLDEHGPDPEPDFDLFWQDRIGTGLGFSAGPDQSRIVMSRDCYLKYAMP